MITGIRWVLWRTWRLRLFPLSLGAALTLSAGFAAAAEPIRVCAGSRAPFLSRIDGEPKGLEYDILGGFAGRQGRRLELIWVSGQDNLKKSLDDGRCDIIGATLSRGAEQASAMDFSTPYFPGMTAVIELDGSGSTSVEDLIGKKVAALAGRRGEERLREIEGVEVVANESVGELARSVEEGTADALVAEFSIAYAMLEFYPRLSLAFVLPGEEPYAFGFPKGSTLRTLLNAHLRSIQGDGTHRTLLRRHFDEEALKLVLGGSG